MKKFYGMLDALAAAPREQRPPIEQQIVAAFQRRRAVLALDMSGFTLTVRRDGILSYLCEVRRMQTLTLPIVAAHEGELVKCEADNVLAVFEDPCRAVEAAMAMIAASVLEPANARPPLNFSIGIDYGDLLLISGADCFGDPVNLAHKLGEDIARPGEVLITSQVREALKGGCGFHLREMPVSFSGVALVAYSVSHGNGALP